MALLDDIKKQTVEVGKKTAEVTEKAIDKTKEVASTAQLRMKKRSVESDLDGAYAKLGEYYYESEKDEDTLSSEAQEMIQVITDLKAKIDDFDKQIEEIKNQE